MLTELQVGLLEPRFGKMQAREQAAKADESLKQLRREHNGN